MVQSELHERLEYLVNYSSQLIFVSGDSVAQQKKTLESFVFQQHDETEIAYLSAKPDMDLSDYRRELCKQLLGTLVGSYVRPLNELLAGLNEHVGPILITITQAEHVPDALLQELWDLVLQSRFAGNKQHLNVLLFGETQWAEKAKKWLPAKNTETPLLISSQSVAAQQPGSELDIMIENRRKAFHEHLANRDGYKGHIETKSASKLSSPLFISLVVILFVCVFGGLVYWQYSDDINALFTPIEQPAPVETSVQPGSAFNELQSGDTEQDVATTGTDNKVVTSWDDAVAAIDDAPKDAEAAAQGQLATEENEDLLAFIEDVTSEPVASDTVVAGDDIATSPELSEEEANSSVATDDSDPANRSAFADSVVDSVSSNDAYNLSREPLSASGFSDMTVSKAPVPTSSKKPEGNQDSSVLSPSVDELQSDGQTDESPLLENNSAEAQIAQTTAPTTTIAPTDSVDNAEEPTSTRIVEDAPLTLPTGTSQASFGSKDYDNQELSEIIDAKDYVIQLAGLKDEALMLEFISDNNLKPYIWVYRTQRYGGDWYVLIFRQQFDSFSAASAEVTNLPPFQGRENAFIKRGQNILDELKIGAN